MVSLGQGSRGLVLMSKLKYKMSYEMIEGVLFCVYRDESGEIKLLIKYDTILEFSKVWASPKGVQDSVIFWTKMIHNPD